MKKYFRSQFLTGTANVGCPGKTTGLSEAALTAITVLGLGQFTETDLSRQGPVSLARTQDSAATNKKLKADNISAELLLLRLTYISPNI